MTLFGDRIFSLRLQLRRVEERDLEQLASWSNQGLAYGDYLTPERLSLEQLAHQLRSGILWNGQSKTFVIELKDGAAIGTLHYWLRAEARETAVMAVKIAVAGERAKGYGTEAQRIMVTFLFNRLGVRAIEMYTDINNTAQQRCLKKLGFELIDSLGYLDHQVERTGHLYRLDQDHFAEELSYHYVHG
ncbi:GNAT family N-acetyltransferase [Desulfogranum mediterraneum]|uniref:GNAT family N-acetyltransferase n=1 Tax=Desulfogranum mediterraneum TaxID=160661 RepID=UPI0004071921|nr:GNAT family N-acetyltransferase [Desulfogranum mediterraneum]